jgi:hypothetical protein
MFEERGKIFMKKGSTEDILYYIVQKYETDLSHSLQNSIFVIFLTMIYIKVTF